MTHTQQHAALARRICLEPANLDLRLVYADWCEEHGDSDRAAFIRLQCRIADLEATCLCGHCVRLRGGGQHTNGPCAVDQERDELPDGRSKQAFLRRRERDLLTAHRKHEWLGSIPEFATWVGDASGDCGWIYKETGKGGQCIRAEFRRGFPEAIGTTAATWLAKGAEIVRAVPVCRVHLTDAIRMREYGSGYERPAIYRHTLGPIYQLACPDATPDGFEDRFAELPSMEFAERLVSYNAILWARRTAGLDVPDGAGGWRTADA